MSRESFADLAEIGVSRECFADLAGIDVSKESFADLAEINVSEKNFGWLDGGYMDKDLSEMSLEELWELFPIILTEHREIWTSWYADEEKRLEGLLQSESIRISHIGSTAISGIWAKPIIDILVELPLSFSMDEMKEILARNDYICMSEQTDRKSFNRGYTKEGFAEKVFHLHLRYRGDNDELYFRDYLNENPLLAKQYEELKLSLWKKFEHDRDEYTSAKTDFVKEQTVRAKKYYGDKYYA